jgi:hypothetical protein
VVVPEDAWLMIYWDKLCAIQHSSWQRQRHALMPSQLEVPGWTRADVMRHVPKMEHFQ